MIPCPDVTRTRFPLPAVPLPAVLLPALLLLGLLAGPAAAAAPDGVPTPASRPPAGAGATQAPGTAQESPVPSPDVVESPAPIVPEGDPLGRIGVVAMIVVAIAGLFIYRVIRKGL